MKRALTCFCVCATALGVNFVLSAQDEGTDDAAKPESAVEGIDPALVKAATAKPTARHFHTLVRFSLSDGDVQVKSPRETEFKKAVEGRFYPNGSTFRTSGGTSEFEFGKECVLKVVGDAEFMTRDAEISSPQRTVMPLRGKFVVSLPRTLPTGLFTMAFPNFTAKDLAGESHFELAPSGDGDETVVHVITGMLAIEGPHYKVLRMSAADRMRIRTTGDSLFTSLRGEAGDYKVSLDQGCMSYKDPITGEVKKQDKRLDFSLTPQCAIKIFRKRSQVGGRMVVSMMTFDPAGEMRNRFTFAEGTSSVNFGEEIVRIQDISFKADKKAAAKSPAAGGGQKDDASDSSGSGSGETSSDGSGSSETGSGGSESSETGGESSGGFGE